MLRRILGKTYLRITGWRVAGEIPDPHSARIFVGAPHTSGLDSVLTLAVTWSNDMRIRFLIKDDLMRGPMGVFWRAVGGIAVNRSDPGPLVAQLAAHAHDNFQLAIAPEGTRKPVEYWKSGFYRLSMASGIPCTLVTPDGPTKIVTFGPTFHPSGDVAADMTIVREFLADKHGVAPGMSTEARMRAEDDPEALAALLASVENDSVTVAKLSQ